MTWKTVGDVTTVGFHKYILHTGYILARVLVTRLTGGPGQTTILIKNVQVWISINLENIVSNNNEFQIPFEIFWAVNGKFFQLPPVTGTQLSQVQLTYIRYYLQVELYLLPPGKENANSRLYTQSEL